MASKSSEGEVSMNMDIPKISLESIYKLLEEQNKRIQSGREKAS